MGLDAGTGELVARWIMERKRLGIHGQHLVCTLQGNRIDPSYVRHLLPRLGRRANITKRVHLHGLRHRYAVDLVQDGADLVTVQQLLGHSSAATTSIYLSRVGASQAVEFARSRTWPTHTKRPDSDMALEEHRIALEALEPATALDGCGF